MFLLLGTFCVSFPPIIDGTADPPLVLFCISLQNSELTVGKVNKKKVLIFVCLLKNLEPSLLSPMNLVRAPVSKNLWIFMFFYRLLTGHNSSLKCLTATILLSLRNAAVAPQSLHFFIISLLKALLIIPYKIMGSPFNSFMN